MASLILNEAFTNAPKRPPSVRFERSRNKKRGAHLFGGNDRCDPLSDAAKVRSLNLYEVMAHHDVHWVVCPISKQPAQLRLGSEGRVVSCSAMALPTMVSCGASCLKETCPKNRSTRLIVVEDGDVSFYGVPATRAQLPEPEGGFGN